MSTAAGYKALAGLRINKPDLTVDLVPTTNGGRVTAYPTTTTLATSSVQRIGPYDLIPLLSEGITKQHTYEDIATLQGNSGLKDMDIVSKLASGSLEVEAHYLGLDNILGLALGYEKPSYNNSPTFDESESSNNPMTGTTTSGTTGTTLQDTGNNQFITANIGEWARIADSDDAKEGQVRRITARSDAGNLTITPAWVTDPGAGKDYQIARVFTHTYECAKNMHVETFDSIYSTYSTETSGSNTDVILRFGTLCIQKTVSFWEWRAIMLNSLSLTHNAKSGVKISLDVIPFDLNLSSLVNTSSSGWNWSAGPTSPIYLQEKIMGGDLTFRIDDWSGSAALDADDNLGISDFTVTLNNNLKVDDQTTTTGLYRVEPMRDGIREITGSFTCPRYTSNDLLTHYESDDILMASAIWEGSTLRGDEISSKNTFKIWLRALKITSVDGNISGPGVTPITFNFKAQIPASASAGMPSVNNTNTEIVIQTINNNPFNVFRAQDGE